MPRRLSPSRVLLGAALALSLSSPSCEKPDSILLVEVASTLPIQPSQLTVVLSANLDSKSLSVPPTPVPGGMRLPTSFTVELDRSRMMPLQVAITALDASSAILACGRTVQQHFQIGGQTVITVFLQPCDDGGNLIDAGSGSDPDTGASSFVPFDGGAD